MPFDVIEYINTPRWLTSRLGLERIRELLDRLGRPQDRLKFVHVAGTNGKGSTCAFTATILAEAGFKTGLFTSPYVETFHERIRVNGRNISDEDLTAATLRVRECAEAMEAEGGEHPTEFELMTAVALVHFAHVGCDIVVLEVGLGGRLDSTNVIAAPEVAAIVSIALDHTNLLGNTLAEIAHEKAGIVKEGSTVVSWPQEPSAMEVVEDAARRAGDKLVVPDFSLLSVGKVTRGAALLTCGTALEHEGHTPCSNSPRFAAELRAEHAPHAQEPRQGPRGANLRGWRPRAGGSVLKQSSLRCGTARGAPRGAARWGPLVSWAAGPRSSTLLMLKSSRQGQGQGSMLGSVGVCHAQFRTSRTCPLTRSYELRTAWTCHMPTEPPCRRLRVLFPCVSSRIVDGSMRRGFWGRISPRTRRWLSR